MKKKLYRLYRKAFVSLRRCKRRIEDYLLNPDSPSDSTFKEDEPETVEDMPAAAAEKVPDAPRPALKPVEEAYARMILLPHGVPVGKPYKRQKEVRRMNVVNFAEAYSLFISLGDVAEAIVTNKGGYFVYKIRDSKGSLHFELSAKPRHYPVHAIATLKITPDEGYDFPLKEVIFCVEPQNKKRK